MFSLLSLPFCRRNVMNRINLIKQKTYNNNELINKRYISSVLWIKGLNEFTKEQEIRTLLSDYGPIRYMKLFTVSDRSKIINAIVRFERMNDCLSAMDELQLTPIQGRRAVLEFGKTDLMYRKGFKKSSS